MQHSVKLEVTPEMIQRYNRPGPRYTSYPTVPVWKEGEFADDYAASLHKEGQNEQPLSLYVHIPFCQQLCTFCGCNKYITNNQNIVEKYLTALEQEIAGVAERLGQRKELAQIHFGGGTPTFLNPEQLSRVVEMIVSRFDALEDCEWAFEANPRVTTTKQLEVLYELGFRRVSFGVQDLDPAIQRAINRNQTAEQSWETLETARSLGYKSINLDLVYGLPLQTQHGFRKTLEEVNKMRPDRLAVYSFAYLPGMFKTHERAIKEKDLPTPEEKINIYLEAINFFAEAGYVMIGMDHYALPEDELAQALKNRTLHRNFMGYTTLHNMAQIGVGVSAISDFGDSYWQNPKELDQYMEETVNNKLIPRRGLLLEKEDQLRRKVIETLMCHGEITIQDFEFLYELDFRQHFAEAWTQLEKFEEEGLVKLSPTKIELTPLGMLFTRNLAMPFDRHLKAGGAPKFSNTV
ncbi:MAG: oxygen-independent coproporphyrinogen III oxidase [SAR324 cluster bacterium]|uniref:Oxygen-independent coproporphyrinogen III oxidase n=1 Tax=marine metagenome TaxID=408172 RepID=A0A381RCZ2_9ZZZZ|nr:oxygen-independent coproporphyrinogen III oxidase [SAR324 cluster bacterium]MDP7171719.1 oxygen-independent coproporphyrinogen III oxidase [SAR324 cluster bacterium]